MGYRRNVLIIAMAMIMVAIPVAADDVGPMADTDGPVFVTDRTPGNAIVGQPMEFNVTLTDDTGVNNASVDYWYITGGRFTVALNRTSGNATNGTWAAVIVPIGNIGPLNYDMYAFDTLGNSRLNSGGNVVLSDVTGPKVEDFTSTLGGIPTTGDAFSFWANVSDDVRVNQVKVHYVVGSPPFLDKNMTMVAMSVDNRGQGLYVYNITVPENTTQSLSYTLWSRDTSNNVRVTRGQVTIRDNDRPEIVDDLSDTVPTTGDMFRFEVDVKDNVEINEVKVFWTYGNTAPRNQTMAATQVDAQKNGKYQRMVPIPDDFEGNFWYQFLVQDGSRRWNVSEVVDLNVTDNDAPMIGPDGSHPVGDDRFDFKVNVTDNIGVDLVWVVYAFEGEAPSNITMTPLEVDSGGNGTYGNVAVGIPLDRQVKLEYFLGARDVNGFVRILSGEYENVDDILPEFGANGSAGEPVKGKSIMVWVEAADNFGLDDVRVEYWFGAAAVKNDTMADEGATFNYTIHIPRDPAGNLTWRFLAADLKGNWNYTPEQSMTPYNLAPEAVDVPVWEVTEEENDILDLQPHLVDGNDPITSLMLTTEADNVTVSGLRLTARFDTWMENFTIEVTVSDGEDETMFSLDITVIDMNDFVVVTSEPVREAQVSVEYEYPVVFTDEDIGQSYDFFFDEAPTGMQVAPNGRITWTPTLDQEGNHNIDLAIDDGFNVVHHQWTITVTGRPTDDPPAFTNSPPTTHEAGTDYVFDFDAEDPDGDAIEFRLVTGPDDAVINEDTGVLVWDTDADKRDTTDNVDFVVRVSDLKHDVDLEFTVALSYPSNDPPEITGSIPKVTTDRDTSVNLGTYMSDPDDDKITLKWNATTDAKAFTVHMNGNHMVVTIKEGKTGKGTVILKLEDPWGEFDTTQVTVVVEASEENGGGLGGNMLYILAAAVAVFVVLGLIYILRGGPKEE